MPLSKLTPSFTFTEDRLRELQAVVPEAFADGKVNWDALREALGNYLEDDEQGVEHFGLSWPGKREARRLAALPSKGTLIPVPGEGVNEDGTRNLFIEGDNLEVLKLLQKSYAGRVKMIYIDPPYNTGNDFVYKDDFKEPLEDYLRKTRQAGESGETLTSNPKASGRFHSNWLNMMYPRLLLAKQLLSDDGAIFISIDDNEYHNLRTMMSEIFGEENLLGPFVWKRRSGANDAQDNISVDHEYILVARDSESYQLGGLRKSFANYNNPDNDPRGTWAASDLTCNKTKQQRPNLFYPITDPETKITYPCNPNRVWAYEPERMARIIDEKKIVWPKEKTGTPQYKRHQSEVRSDTKPVSTWIESSTRKEGDIQNEAEQHKVAIWQTELNQQGTKDLRALFGEQVFNYPKPVVLIKNLVAQATVSSEKEIVLDFFSGSSTTATAVLDINNDDNGNRQFIMVQLPELTGNAKFPTIAEIGKERIRRAIKKIKAEAKGKLKLGKDIDLGFKVFKLARSNYRAWQDYTGDYAEELETLFTQAETPLVEGWTPEGLLTETLLLEGFPLDSAVTEQAEFKHNQVWRVESDACAHRLWVCFDKKIKDKTLEALALPGEDIFICLDSALTDEAKVRLSDVGNVHVI